MGRVSGALLITLLVAGQSGVAAQEQAPPVWQFENVSQGNIIPGCINGMTLAGFEYGPDGRPVIAWREENGCGFRPSIFWTRKESGQWHQTEFLSERRYNGGAQGDYAHQLALRKSDGNPFLIYADVGASNEVNTYQTDLGAYPGGGFSTYLEALVGPQRCAGVNYSPAFGPADGEPQWTTGLWECNEIGPIRLRGKDIASSVYKAHASLAIGADGMRHVLWNTGSDVYYSRVPAGAEIPDQTKHLFDDLNRFGGEVRIAIDGDGTLHAIVRGPDISADWDLGAIVYLKSTDGGTSWSSREYVDPHDDPAVQNPWNANSDLSFAIDADGVPAVSFWRWNSELWYARRDGRNGTWSQQLVSALPFANPVRANQLRFDPDGTPVIAFYDPAARMVRLARPVPSGAVMPIDVGVTATASPAVVPAGATTTVTLTVTNKGVTNLDRVVLANRLPEGASFVSAAPAQGADGQWTFALTSGAATTVTIVATAPLAEGATADVATVSIDAADDHPEDNAAAAGICVQSDQSQPACGTFTPSSGTDVAVVVHGTPATVAPGGFASFLISVTNTGTVDLQGVNVDNYLGGGATFVDAAPNPQSAIGGTQNFNVGDLAVGEQKWIAVRVMAPFVPGTMSSQAHHLIDGDQNTANDESRGVVQVVPDMCFVPPSSLVGRWRAEGDVSDAIGGAAGSMVGGASFEVGRSGQAFRIHGTGSYVEVPDAEKLKPAQFTIGAWVNAPSFAKGGFDTAIAKGGSGQDGDFGGDLDSYWLGFRDGRPTLYTQHQNGTAITQSQTPVAPMQWHHLAATFDGTIIRLYVNGVEVAQNVVGSPLKYDSHDVPLLFGDDWQYGYASGDADFNGLIDEVTIHDRALSADEMRAMVDGSTAPACLAVAPDPAAPIRNGIPEARPQFSGVGMILPSATHGGCTATMISPFTVLTAAQCLIDSLNDPVFEFSLGQGRTARLTDIRRHPLAFSADGFNQAFDVAVASLDRAVAASWTDVVPATLRAEQPTPIVDATAVGFGATNDGGRRTSGTVLVTDYASFMGPDGVVQFEAVLIADPGSANQMFCSAGTGGPLFFEDQIIGVAAFRNVATCAEDGPGFYINTSRVADWIHTTTNEIGNRPPTTNVIGDQVSFEGQPIFREARASDPDFDPVTLTVQGLPSFVTVTQLSPSSVRFSGTPPAGSAGTYPFTLTVSDGIVEVVQQRNWIVRRPNRPPVAVDDTFNVAVSVAPAVNVLANDSDPDGNALTLLSVSGATQGTTQMGPGGISYHGVGAPPYDEHLTYTIRDEFGAMATAAVTLHVLGSVPDVSVTVVPEPPSILSGQKAVYRVRVRNLSMLPSNPATLTVFPDTAVSFTVTPAADAPGAWIWSLGVLDPAETVDVLVTLSPSFPGPTTAWTLRAGVQASGDLHLADNISTGVVTLYPDYCFAPSFGQLVQMPFDWSAPLTNVVTGQDATGIFPDPLPLVPDSYRSMGFRFTRATSLVVPQPLQAASVPIAPGEFTLSVWIKPDDLLEAGEEPVMSQAGPDIDVLYWLGFKNGRPALVTRHENGATVETTGAPVSLNAWHHLAGTYDGSMARLYVDGVLVASTDVGAPILGQYEGSGDILIGATSSTAQGVSAVLDEAVMYARAFPDSEIRTMVAGPASACAAATNPDVAVNIVAVPDVVPTRGHARFAITATNLSNGYTPDISLTHDLPPGAALVRANAIASGSVQSDLVGPSWLSFVYHVGHMAPGQSLLLNVETIAPDLDGRYVSAVTVAPGYANPGNHHPQATLIVEDAECYLTHADGSPDTCQVNDPPALENPGSQTNNVGDQVQLDLVAQDPEQQSLQFAASGLPAGLTMDPSTGRISGNVVVGATGVHAVRVVVTDGTLSDSVEFEWAVKAQLTLQVAAHGAVQVEGGALCDGGQSGTTCIVNVPIGTSVRLIPTSLVWWGDGGTFQQGGGTFTAVMSRPRTIEAVFIRTYAVGLAGHTTGQTSVYGNLRQLNTYDWSQANPGFMYCEHVLVSTIGADCSGLAPIGTEITLLPSPATSEIFTGWTGVCSGMGSCSFTLASSLPPPTPAEPFIAAAHFALKPTTLTIDVGPGGLVRFGSGEACDGGTTGLTCTATFPWGTSVTLAPEAEAGMRWSYSDRAGVLSLPENRHGLAPGVTVSATFSMSGDQYVFVRFWTTLTVALTDLIGSWDYLTTSPGPNAPNSSFPLRWGTENCGALLCENDFIPEFSCAMHQPYGVPCTGYATWGQTFSMTPREGLPQDFLGWSGACSGAATCTFTAGSPGLAVTGAFRRPNHAPITSAIPAVSTLEDASDLVIPIGARFGDVDGDALTFAVGVDAQGLVVPTLEGNNLRLHFVSDASGSRAVTVTATDPGGLSVSNPFSVIVTSVNDAPSVDPIADRSIPSGIATSIALTNLLPGPADESTQQLSVTATSSNPSVTGPVTFVSGVLRLTPPSRTSAATATVTVLVQDDGPTSFGGSNHTQRTFALIVTASNTLPGSNVQVAAIGPLAVSPISVTFSSVTGPGQTTYTTQLGAFAPPDGFRFGTPPITFDISTSATYTAPLRVCVTYAEATYLKPAAIRLFHYENGHWVDRTVSIDTTAHIVCASVSSLSPFAVAEPEDLEGRMSGGGQLSAAGVDYRFDFHIAERHIGEERGHLDLTIATPKSGKKKESRDEFTATAIDGINFWDDPAFLPGRFNRPQPQTDSAVFTGAGKWNSAGGYTFEARATDQGEPGRGRDQFSITIRNAGGAIVASVNAAIDEGNIQSERLNPAHWTK